MICVNGFLFITLHVSEEISHVDHDHLCMRVLHKCYEKIDEPENSDIYSYVCVCVGVVV